MDPHLFRGLLPPARTELSDGFRRIEEERRLEREDRRLERRERRDKWWSAIKSRIADAKGAGPA